jgi:hypothetical protein
MVWLDGHKRTWEQLGNGNLLQMGVAEADPAVLYIALPAHLVSALTLVPLGSGQMEIFSRCVWVRHL